MELMWDILLVPTTGIEEGKTDGPMWLQSGTQLAKSGIAHDFPEYLENLKRSLCCSIAIVLAEDIVAS